MLDIVRYTSHCSTLLALTLKFHFLFTSFSPFPLFLCPPYIHRLGKYLAGKQYCFVKYPKTSQCHLWPKGDPWNESKWRASSVSNLSLNSSLKSTLFLYMEPDFTIRSLNISRLLFLDSDKMNICLLSQRKLGISPLFFQTFLTLAGCSISFSLTAIKIFTVTNLHVKL